jgi:hypothetical protein
MCRSSIEQENSTNIHITDSLLKSISQYLPQLEHLNLADCPRVTSGGVWSMIKDNVKNLKELGLKNLSPVFASFIIFALVTRR